MSDAIRRKAMAREFAEWAEANGFGGRPPLEVAFAAERNELTDEQALSLAALVRRWGCDSEVKT